MIGCTPSNIATRQIARGDVMVVTGVNLPMLVTVAKARERGALERVAQLALEAGRRYVNLVSPVSVPVERESG